MDPPATTLNFVFLRIAAGSSFVSLEARKAQDVVQWENKVDQTVSFFFYVSTSRLRACSDMWLNEFCMFLWLADSCCALTWLISSDWTLIKVGVWSELWKCTPGYQTIRLRVRYEYKLWCFNFRLAFIFFGNHYLGWLLLGQLPQSTQYLSRRIPKPPENHLKHSTAKAHRFKTMLKRDVCS